jgi:hypothetical protein
MERPRLVESGSRAQLPSVAVLYLCAGDVDRRALASLCRLSYRGRLDLYVHDDSPDPAVACEVDRLVASLATADRSIRLLRRPVRRGGKPGAVNYVLEQIADRYDLLLLCDNDSTAVDRDAVERAVPFFDDPRTAAVQFRNVGLSGDDDGPINRVLISAIEVFDVFAMHQSRHGLLPFLGHNGMVRLSAVKSVGGLREGCLSDDIDLSVRLALAGWNVRYARDIRFGECHPGSYGSFRRRAFKWSHGCGEILRRHLIPVLRSRVLSPSQKLGFFEFASFYGLQLLLIAYLVLGWLVMPWLWHEQEAPRGMQLASNFVVLSAIFLPALVYHHKRARFADAWPFAWICALVYGSVAFVASAGVIWGLLGRPVRWVPTNLRRSKFAWVDARLLVEFAFGLALFVVPALFQPALLAQPTTYLFVCVFLLAPLVDLFYRPLTARRPGVFQVGRGLAGRAAYLVGATLVFATFVSLRSGAAAQTKHQHVAIHGKSFLVDGAPFLVKGMHYSPWRPGTGPGKQYPWPDGASVEQDLALIQGLGVNTIIVHDAPESILEQAARHDLMVVAAFFINWQSIDDENAFRQRTDEIVAAVAGMSKHDHLLGVLLGNEVPQWVRDQRGNELIETRLRELCTKVREVAPGIPLSHANWPVTRDLDLSFCDFSAFNLYPAWPREVVVRGYGAYIDEVLLPIAGNRPLLISEFGQNTLEASEERQSFLLKDCWQQIQSRCAGGVVFEFADEWWKNYDNPVADGDFWKRESAPRDELTHDLDPEEYYGVFTDQREPKPAAAAVREMFQVAAPRSSTLPWYGAALLAALVAYTVHVFRREARLAARQVGVQVAGEHS